MKRFLVLGMLLSAVVAVNYAHAESNSGQVKESPAKEVVKDCPISLQENKDIYQQLEGMLKEVGLTDSQKKDIAGIIQAEKGRVALIQKKAGESWNELMGVSFAIHYSQSRYDLIVNNLSGLFKQVIEEHGQMMLKINGILTNQQREKVLKLLPKIRRHRQSSSFGFNFDFGSF
jgi:Spy/CpxP family protein refolding chaperone